MFPSPTSSLPSSQLKILLTCIQDANKRLLAAGSEQLREQFHSLQLHLLKMQQMFVTVTIVYKNKRRFQLTGTIEDAGINFLLLRHDDKIIIVPFENIFSIQCDHKEKTFNAQTDKLSAYSDKQRLVQNFSDIVAKSPFLINLFFGLPLHLYLNSYVGCDVRITIGSTHGTVTGSITEALSHTVELRHQQQNVRVDYDDLLYIELFLTTSE